MKRVIIFRSLLMVFAALVIFGIVSAFILQNQYIGTMRSELRKVSSVISEVHTSADYGALARKLADLSPESYRITFISADGRVLGDSVADSSTMENHLNRPEVAEALKTGYGEDIRRSHTLGTKYMYVAKRMPDGNVVRVSVALKNPYDHLLTLLPALLLGIFVSLLAAPFLALRFANGILRQFYEVAESLRAVNAGEGRSVLARPEYPELAPIAQEINTLSQKISETLNQLTTERRRVDYLLNNMTEGLVVLDRSLTILTVNSSAASYFGISGDLKGQNLLCLTHLPKVVEAAKRAVEDGAHSAFDLPGQADGKILQIFVSPVPGEGEGERGGAIMLITDITAIRRAEQIRSEFVANASHELKTPLTSIKGFAELIANGIVADTEQVKKYLSLIISETERMMTLINDILRISELETIHSDSSKSSVSLKLIAQQTAESLALQAGEKDVAIRVSGDSGICRANADRMTQLFLNLLDNAIKYNVRGGRADVYIKDLPEGVEITVEDTGIGIPRQSQERVFERFYRVDKSRSRKLGGTGLGLSIVKHIVGLYKGRISLESEVGKGTRIVIFLPKL